MTEDESTIAGQAIRGGLITLLGQVGRLVILGVNLVVLGRLLAPTDFGLFALAFALVGVAELLRDFGLSAAAIQAKTLSIAERTNLFWLNTLLGLSVAAIVAGLSGPLATLLNQPALQYVILGMSLTFLINGVGTQYQAQLSRDFRFATVALSDLSGQMVGIIVAVTLAAHGAGYWALVAMQIVAALITLIIRVWRSRWFPTLPHRSVSVRPFMRFGLHLGAAQALGHFAANAPTVVLGATQTPYVTGVYSRSYQLVMVPVSQVFGPLTNVALSALAKIDEAVRFRSALADLSLMVTFSGTVCFGLIAATSPALVPIVMGSAWRDAVPVVAALAVGASFQALTYPYLWAFLATARTRSLLRYNVVTKVLLGALASVGATRSAESAAWGCAIALAVAWPVCVAWLWNEVRVDSRRQVTQSARCIAASLSGLLCLVALDATVLDTRISLWRDLALSSSLWSACALATFLFFGGRRDLRRLTTIALKARPARG